MMDFIRKHTHIIFFAISGIASCYLIADYLYHLLQIHIFRHDSIYYLTGDFSGKLKREGRWLNYYLFDFLLQVPGKLAVFLNILFFFLSALLICYRQTRNILYSLILACLITQIPPLMAQVLWPVYVLPATFLLLVSVIVSTRMPVYVYYGLFGILIFGTMNNFYYLLPLAHLLLLNKETFRENIRIFILSILPAWAVGFVVGYLFSVAMVYFVTGQVGIEINSWRTPNPVENFNDLMTNVISSCQYLIHHIGLFLFDAWRSIVCLIALLIGLKSLDKSKYFPRLGLLVAVIVAHYIIILPIGIMVSFRTIIALYVGLIVLLFLPEKLDTKKMLVLSPLALLLTISFSIENGRTMTWYSQITNLHHDELIQAAPQPPESYEGVLFYGSSDQVSHVNRFLEEKHSLNPGNVEDLNANWRWPPIGYEAGFKTVLHCYDLRNRLKDLCKKIHRKSQASSLANTDHETQNEGLYVVHGVQNGMLVVSLNASVIH